MIVRLHFEMAVTRGAGRTDDPGRPTDAWFVEDTLKYRLPVLLEPSSPPGGEVGKVSLSVHNVGFDRFVLVSASSDETSSPASYPSWPFSREQRWVE